MLLADIEEDLYRHLVEIIRSFRLHESGHQDWIRLGSFKEFLDIQYILLDLRVDPVWRLGLFLDVSLWSSLD